MEINNFKTDTYSHNLILYIYNLLIISKQVSRGCESCSWQGALSVLTNWTIIGCTCAHHVQA